MAATTAKNTPRTTAATEFENKFAKFRAKKCVNSRVEARA